MAAPLTDVDTFTDPVIVPEAGDDRTSVSVNVAFQALANRTRHHKALFDGYGAAPHVWGALNTFAIDIDYDAPKTFSRWLTLSAGVTFYSASPASPRAHIETGSAVSLPGMTYVTFPTASTVDDTWTGGLDLPTGAVITDLRLGVLSSDSTHLVHAILSGYPQNPTTGVRGSAVAMRSCSAVGTIGTGTPAEQGVSVPIAGGASQAIDRGANQYELSVSIQDVPGTSANAYLTGVWVQYTMPGYRNG